MKRTTPAHRPPAARLPSSLKITFLKTVATLAAAGLLGCVVFVGLMEFGMLHKTSRSLFGVLGCVALLAAALFYAFLELGASGGDDEIRPAPESSTLTFPPEPRFTARSSVLDRTES